MSSKNTICRACESGSLVEKTCTEGFVYKDIKFLVNDYLYSVCDDCGYEVVTTPERKLNDKKIREQHRDIDGLISGHEIKRIRKKFDLTQHDAAEIFGGGANAFSKYENDDVIQSKSMDRLLRVADLVPGVFHTLVSIEAKQTLRLKSSQQYSMLSCDYGECDIADSKNLPKNIIQVGVFTEAKKKKFKTTISHDWPNTAVL